ncbi:MAG TPA: DUF3043 domain-containing protein [Lacisediminihabitans sp.]|uniref:DUF3043 domain-containing protein n=1 Tax=Lacisediminihabitans sp. TaxID=2787631 RepID=UPI002ED84D82
MAKQRTDKADDAVDELGADGLPGGKGHPTPTRKEREAANMRPLVAGDRKTGNKQTKARMAEAREKARIGMANGDEKYLPIRDKGPQRRFIRDYIDARFSVGELIIPVMFVVIVLTFVNSPILQTIAIFGLWIFFLVAVIDCLTVGYIIQRKLAAKFGAEKVQRGNRWYTAMRALQLRPMRLPKPQVKRGNFPA